MDKFYYNFIGDNTKELKPADVKMLLRYMGLNKDKLVVIDDYIFDSVSLSSKICLSTCDKCEEYSGHNCCCGNSYAMPEKNAKFVDSIAREALKLSGNERKLQIVENQGALTKSNSTKSTQEECIFQFRNEEGVLRCALHYKALCDDARPAAYKPYTCSLFPIFSIIFPNNKIGFFSITKETRGFSPYFYTLTRRYCVNYDITEYLLKGGQLNNKYYSTLKIDIMKQDNLLDKYNPAYLEQEGILRYFVGDEVYDKLISHF